MSILQVLLLMSIMLFFVCLFFAIFSTGKTQIALYLSCCVLFTFMMYSGISIDTERQSYYETNCELVGVESRHGTPVYKCPDHNIKHVD